MVLHFIGVFLLVMHTVCWCGVGMSKVDKYSSFRSLSSYFWPHVQPINPLFLLFFSIMIRTPRTKTTWGLLEGKCRSPVSCRRSFIPKPKPRTAASTCWAPFKASVSAQRRSRGGNTARRPLQHQRVGTLVESCDQYVITGTISHRLLILFVVKGNSRGNTLIHDCCSNTNCASTSYINTQTQSNHPVTRVTK